MAKNEENDRKALDDDYLETNRLHRESAKTGIIANYLEMACAVVVTVVVIIAAVVICNAVGR